MNASEKLKLQLQKLSKRERAIVFVMILAVLVFIWDQLLFSPMQRDTQQARQRINALNSEMQTLSEETATLGAAMLNNPNLELEKRIGELETRFAAMEGEVGQFTSNLIPPRQMAEVLESVLRQQTRLRLIKVTNLPAEVLAGQEEGEESTNTEDAASELLYRHGVELELVGEYFETLRYLQALENLPWRILWQRLDYEVDVYPNARIRLRLNTLSTSQGWIGV